MYNTSAMKNYEPLLVPIDKPFSELSKKEAKKYFEWFISNIDVRVEYLKSIIASDLKISTTEIDLSLESLKLVWKWFLQIAEISKTPKKVLQEIEKSLSGQPNSFVDHMLKQYEDELSIRTEYVLRDIGMYIAKMFVEHHSCLQWSIVYKPKSYVHVNEPIIIGFVDDNPSYPKTFYPELEPIDLARTPAMRLFDGTQEENDLYDRCLQWIQWIPKNTGDEVNQGNQSGDGSN